MRYRSTIAALTALLGVEAVLVDVPPWRECIGLGIGDWPRYARVLAERFGYTNTSRDGDPRLDLTEPPPAHLVGCHDFVIAGDVLEHVAPPVVKAMSNLRALLRPGGAAILTVPYSGDSHVEHFPELYRYEMVNGPNCTPVLVNVRRDGTEEQFHDLRFHGPGRSLEMRVFSRDSFVQRLREAGFQHVEFFDTQLPQHGIVHQPHWPVPVIASP